MWEPRYRPFVRVDKEKAGKYGRGELGVGGVKKEAKGPNPQWPPLHSVLTYFRL